VNSVQERSHEIIKSLLPAGAMIVATGATSFADGFYWVVGNRATSKCGSQARTLDHRRLPEG